MIIMGHRGARNEKPENTLLGFKHAIDCGVQAIELDIHKTKDHQLVVIHDDSLDRTTNGTGKVLEMNLSEIKKYDAGLGETVPLLSEALNLFKEREIQVQIEIKAPHLEELVLETISICDMKSLSTVICFNHRILRKLKELDPEIETTALLYGLPVNAVEVVKACNANGISLNIRTIDEQLVKECQKEGLTTTVWNVNSKSELSHFQKMGVDVVATDCPQHLLEFVDT